MNGIGRTACERAAQGLRRACSHTWRRREMGAMTTTLLAPAVEPTAPAPGRLLLRLGYEIVFDVPAPTPMLLMLYAHPSVAHRLVSPDIIHVEPQVQVTDFI